MHHVWKSNGRKRISVMSITLQSEDQVYIFCVSIKVFHRLWFDNPKKGKAAVSAQGGFAVFRCTQRRPRATEARRLPPTSRSCRSYCARMVLDDWPQPLRHRFFHAS
jgi:hypothetical protein